ncbi:exported protein of unknown function [Tenacibaculum sp. 190524A02b]|uniref:Uncharacterized protein n=1 Tax=Tenacibaculum vairaonense TaxID=3137860 RepID=A0ABP1FG72_9FLAO
MKNFTKSNFQLLIILSVVLTSFGVNKSHAQGAGFSTVSGNSVTWDNNIAFDTNENQSNRKIYFGKVSNNTPIFKYRGERSNDHFEMNRNLYVDGLVRTNKVVVLTNVIPDYVFEKYYTGTSNLKKDYKMLSLKEIEEFTKKNNHLPNVPSVKEVQKNGLEIGEMTKILLEKIEELTLHLIEQDKEINKLKSLIK